MKNGSVRHIGIIGAGMIGGSMAVLTTGHGYRTTCLVRNPAKISEYEKTYENYFGQLIGRGVMPPEQFRICRRYLGYTTDIGELADCEIVFECVAEDLALKHKIYADIESRCRGVRAVCSVSSSFTADTLASASGRLKDRIIVTHPFNPAHMVPYFELCGGGDTDQAVLLFAKDVLESLGRKPVILKKPTPGFIGNRLQFALWREALNLVDSGVCDPRDVDTCLRYSFCPRYTSIGMFEHFDNGGLLLNGATCDTVFPELSNIDHAPPSITDRIARGATGARAESMTGFYDWRGVDMDVYHERVNEPYWQFIDWDMPEE